MEIKDNDDITLVQALVLCLLVLVCIILFLSYPYIVSVMEWLIGVNKGVNYMKENNLGFKLAMTAWVSVSFLMALGFIVNIISAIK